MPRRRGSSLAAYTPLIPEASGSRPPGPIPAKCSAQRHRTPCHNDAIPFAAGRTERHVVVCAIMPSGAGGISEFSVSRRCLDASEVHRARDPGRVGAIGADAGGVGTHPKQATRGGTSLTDQAVRLGAMAIEGSGWCRRCRELGRRRGSPRCRSRRAVRRRRRRERVAVDELAEGLWPSTPPPSARKSLQAHVARLRRVSGAAAIVGRGGGYRLDPGLVEVDAGAGE